MGKIKLITGSIIGLLLSFGVFAGLPVSANGGATVLQIQTLPGYINYTDFKLSCTTDGVNTAKFYAKKDGGSYSQFTTVDLSTNPCQASVNNSQFGSEGKFWFKVEVDGLTSETQTTLDTTAPSGIGDFGKGRTGGGTVYHLTWKNPTDTDYAKVFIYRGETPGFESDGHKIVEAGGSPGDTMSYDDGSLDPNKEYYYYIRALDKANNASGLVGDTSVTTVYSSPEAGTGEAVTILPSEGGSVLGSEATTGSETTMEPTTLVGKINQYASTQPSLIKWILTHKKISIGLLVIFGLVAYQFYAYNKRNK